MASTKGFDFSGEVAIVTGAGSRLPGEIGNGRAAAILLAQHGARVSLVDSNVEWAQETKRMIDLGGGISEVIQADVTDEESCKNVVAQTVKLFGALHILVNNVGVANPTGDVTRLNLEEWNRDFTINVTSMALMSKYAIPEMRKNGRGSIVNISSVNGLITGDPNLLYPTSKAAVIQMTRTMAAHHGHENIRVNCVCPGMAYTPMVRVWGLSERQRQQRINFGLLKQVEGTGWDIGNAILFLSSKEAKWITAVILPVDGGTVAGRSDRPDLEPDSQQERKIRDSKL